MITKKSVEKEYLFKSGLQCAHLETNVSGESRWVASWGLVTSLEQGYSTGGHVHAS